MRVSIFFVCFVYLLLDQGYIQREGIWEEEKEEMSMFFLSLYISCE